MAFTHQVQTAHFVNQLVYNTSIAIVKQECIDKKVEAKLHALEVVLLNLGEYKH